MARLTDNPQAGEETESQVDNDPTGEPAFPDLQSLDHIGLLLKTVETELIPRLFVSHMMDVPVCSPLVENRATYPVSGPWSSQIAIESFALLCINNDPAMLDRRVTDLLAQGVSLESIFLHLLAPVARHLGDLWSDDKLSFVDVHLGLCRLHQLICECEAIGYRSENMPVLDQSILLTCVPGDEHTFGITMVADFFRRYGWQVSNLCGLDVDFLMTRVSSTYYSAVGFSLHSEVHYASLEAIIKQVRHRAKNPDLIILVGGDFFICNPGKVNDIGADVFASDGHQAVLMANNASKRAGTSL